jgi:NAD(P)-dependent dehydrogenase (short-subunit alcohol dehydrogenase family)
MEIIKSEIKIDILIHNAAFVSKHRKTVNDDGIEKTMATNLYGPFLMTHLLINFMRESAPSRIVFVSSKAHTLSFLDPRNPEHLNPINYWLPQRLYSNSKMAGLLCMFEMAERLKGSGVTVNAVHPGTFSSELWQNVAFPINIASIILRFFLKSTEEAIQTTLYASLSKHIEGITGQYFRDCKIGMTHPDTQKVDWQKIMFEEARKIVGLNEKDPSI